MEKIDGQINMFSYLGDYGGCGTIRVIYPYLLLNQYRPKANLSFIASYGSHIIPDIGFYGNYTWIQFQRSATKENLTNIRYFRDVVRKKTSVPLFYEIDDNLFDIPKWNMAYSFYEERKPYIEEIMRIVDGIIVSSEKLKERYSYLNQNIKVIENHLPLFIWGKPKPLIKDTNRLRIIYPCSSNHFAVNSSVTGGDISKKLLNYIRKTADIYEWIFIGGFPMELNDFIGKIKRLPWINIFNYADFLKELKPDIGIAPLSLEHENFNACKCLVGDTYVVTERGMEEIRNVVVGNFVYQNGFKKITNKVKYHKQRTLKIETARGFHIEGTRNHKLSNNKRFITMEELCIGDKLDLSFFEFYKNEIETNNNYCRLLGYLVENNTLPLTIDSDIYNDIKGICNEFDIWFIEKNKIYIAVKKIDDIPWFVMSNKTSARQFLMGLFEMGQIDEDTISVTCSNKKIVRKVLFMLCGFKILGRIEDDKIIIDDLHRFKEELGFISRTKKAILFNIKTKPKEYDMTDVIVSITEGLNDVYDIEVPDGHYYVANGIISHNSNIKALEYTATGIPAVYTDIEPYKNLKCKAKDDDEFIHYIEKMKSASYRYSVYQHDYNTLKDQLYWEGEDYSYINLKNYVNTYLSFFNKEI